ncbi:MAG: hypothetical protein HKN36_09185 [Hellea sp.]|nr:hypothetical protein [Hellea sp.]
MNANASVAIKLRKAGIDRFVKRQSKTCVNAAIDAIKAELSDFENIEVKPTGVKSTASHVSASLMVSAQNGDILSEELGTETQSPAHKVSRLVKDPETRKRIVQQAAKSL